MNHVSAAFFNAFEIELESLKNSHSEIIHLSHEAVKLLENKIEVLHKDLKKFKFESIQEEIYFFKVLKPSLNSKLIYYDFIFQMESKMPLTKKQKIKFIEKELEKINDFNENNNEFYKYYRTRACNKDEDYFVRTKKKIVISSNCYKFNYNKRVSTLHDYDMAILIANDMLTIYLENRLEAIENPNSINNHIKSILIWPGSKIDFVEMTYALHYQHILQGGTTDIKYFATQLAKPFNIEIDEKFYRSYYDIKARKTGKTKFLDKITENFLASMEEDDK